MRYSHLSHRMLIRLATPRRVRFLHTVKSRESWGPEQISAYHDRLLREMIHHCWKTVPFYREHWRSALSDPSDVRTVADLAYLPPVTRAQFHEHAGDVVTADPSVQSTEARTGGSTAAPIVYRTTAYDDELSWAQIYNGWTWAGWRLGEPFLVVGGESVGVGLGDKRTWRDWLLNRWVTSGSNITRERARRLAQSPGFRRATLIYGYPNSIRELCEHLHELGAHPLRLRAVVCTAEVMLPEVRQRISQLLGGVPVFDQWGLGDGAQHACEGPDRDGLHVSFHRGILEIVDDADRPITVLHRSGRGLATSLTNRATPFVRYETGDQLRWHSFAPAPCGIAWPRLGPVEGRIGDVIFLSTGRSIPMPGLTLVMRWMDGLKQYQFIQTGPSAVTVRLDPGSGFRLSEDDAKRFLRHRIAEEVEWTIHWGSPELTRGGKLLVIRNDWLRARGLSRPPQAGALSS